jgi:outer membrane immunogenic protein
MRVNQLLASTALTTSAVFATGAALAQPAPYSWTGCYVGLNAGGMTGHINQSLAVPPSVNTTFSSSGTDIGFIGGGQAGCNWQSPQNWVLGFEGDFNFAHARRSQNFAFFGSEDVVGSQETKLLWLSTVRARFGYAWNRSLLYATGGLAIGGVESSASASVPTGPAQYFGSYSGTRVGWTIGGGFEQAITDMISARFEYLHFDLGEADYNVVRVSGTTALPATWLATAKVNGDIFRVGVNFKLTP